MLTELATHFDLLAQGGDFDNWGDLLVVAVMAILWLAGALAKVITSKKNAEKQQETSAKPQPRKRESWQERLTRKAHEMQQAAEARARQMQQQAGAHSRSAPPAGKVTIRKDQKGDSVLVYERPPARPSTQREQRGAPQRSVEKPVRAPEQRSQASLPAEPQLEIAGIPSEPLADSLIASAREASSPMKSAGAACQGPQQATGIAASSIIDYSDPDALRKAVLHYEILGKPIALRDLTTKPTIF